MYYTGTNEGEFDTKTIATILVALALTWAISELSFRYFETPLLKLKDRFRTATPPEVQTPIIEAS
jgi:peptidoglycan/LPS O-acetylase OafA/YrhL